jgi:membrane glycosyltransferase
MGYLLSPLWFVLLVIWALIGNGEEGSVLTYFSPENPLMPTWPEMTEGRHLLVLLLMYAMLLAPKLLGVLALPLTGRRYGDLGGAGRVALSALVEIVLSILYAPILMVQQMIAVFRSLTGLQQGWEPQARAGGQYPLRQLAVAHALETVAGMALLAGLVAGLVTVWLLPIAVSLALAIPLSAFSGWRMQPRILTTPEAWSEPKIIAAAKHYRAQLKSHLEGVAQSPAE